MTPGEKPKNPTKGCSGRVRADCSGNCVWDKRCKKKPNSELWGAITRVCLRMDQTMHLMAKALVGDSRIPPPESHFWRLHLLGNNIKIIIESDKDRGSNRGRAQYVLKAAGPRPKPYASGYVVNCPAAGPSLASSVIHSGRVLPTLETKHSTTGTDDLKKVLDDINNRKSAPVKCQVRQYAHKGRAPTLEMSPSAALKLMLDDVPSDRPPERTLRFYIDAEGANYEFSTGRFVEYATQVPGNKKDLDLILEHFDVDHTYDPTECVRTPADAQRICLMPDGSRVPEDQMQPLYNSSEFMGLSFVHLDGQF